jgi:hypothetical protein
LGQGQPRDGNQARAGWTPKSLILLSICLGWSSRRQLTLRFAEARETVAALYPQEGPLPVSYQGFFKQLGCANVALLRSAVAQLRKRAPAHLRSQWSRHNWVPFAVDGSRIEAPRTAANEEAMGCAGRSGTGPQMWVTLITHLPSGLPWNWRQGPGTSSERHHLLEMIADLPKNALAVGDAGFVSYEGMSAMDQTGRRFLIRCGGNITLRVDGQPVRKKLQPNRHGTRVYLWPDQAYRKKLPPLVLRLIVLKRKHQRVYLLTNVRAATELPKWMASEFYQARWGIEVTYRSLKQTMDRRRLLSKSPANAQMELAANLLALFVLVLHGIMALGIRCVRMSLARILPTVQRAMEAVRWHDDWYAFSNLLRNAVKDEYHRRLSSKQARHWPHKKKDKPPSPPKLRTLRSAERQRMREIAVLLRKTG